MALAEMVHVSSMFGDGEEEDAFLALGPVRGGRFWRLK